MYYLYLFVAVDAHVGRYLFDECICGKLGNKTRVLMTNQLQFLEKADNIIVVGEGEIVRQGKYEELRSQGIDFSEFIMKRSLCIGEENAEEEKEKFEEIKSAKELEGLKDSVRKELMTEEEQSTSCFFNFILIFLSFFFSFFLFFFFSFFLFFFFFF
jgi:ATP-binding cassette subfamily C (CFTR/MRP) protein 1